MFYPIIADDDHDGYTSGEVVGIFFDFVLLS
jgi:hypothetical protein